VPARGPEAARAQRARAVATAGRRPPSRGVERAAAKAGEPRDSVRETQRARILAATVQSIAEVGYAQLSITDVVARARVSRGTFYELFADREDVFLEALNDAVARISATVERACAGEGSWEKQMRAGLETVLEVLDEEPALARLCVVEAQQAGPRVLRRRAEILDGFARIVDEGRDGDRHRRGGGPPPLTAHSLVAGAVSVVHERLLTPAPRPLAELAGPLASMIVFPYRGPAAAARELARPARRPARRRGVARLEQRVPLEDVGGRLTYRSARVLGFVAEHPEANNREVADGVGISDQGQISKLLARLASLGLIENTVEVGGRGIANAWRITPGGEEIRRAVKL
jgi:AcrR family transcriptional regulator